MNIIPKFAAGILELQTKRDATLSIEERMAYDDAMCIFKPIFELAAKSQKDTTAAFVGVAESLDILAECHTTEAI